MSDWGSVVAFVLVAGAAWAVARPLWAEDHARAEPERPWMREDLLARKEQLLAALRELDEDRESGRLSEDDYLMLRARLKAEAAGVLRELDTLTSAAGEDNEQRTGDRPSDERA